jgi:hypothetical protein
LCRRNTSVRRCQHRRDQADVGPPIHRILGTSSQASVAISVCAGNPRPCAANAAPGRYPDHSMPRPIWFDVPHGLLAKTSGYAAGACCSRVCSLLAW